MEDDQQFCRGREQLRAETRSLFEQAGDRFEYQRFLARLERSEPTIKQGHSPGWKGSIRCRCWWDAKDELLEIANYLEEFISKIGSQQMTNNQRETGPVQKMVTVKLVASSSGTEIPECLFRVSVVDSSLVGHPREKSSTDFYEIRVAMTWELRVNWKLEHSGAEMDVVKVLFEHCREHVAERLAQSLPLEHELLLTMENSPDHCPYDIARIADPANPVSFAVGVESQGNAPPGQKIELFVEDIDTFGEARNIKPQDVKALLPLALSEDEIQTMFEEIIGENFHQGDWGGEINDLVTSHITVGGKRLRAAFLLKGSGTKGKLTIAKCGKNGDQILRLTEAPADLYVIQHVGEIDQRVTYDLRDKVLLRVSKGESCQMCILDGTETARILKAYHRL